MLTGAVLDYAPEGGPDFGLDRAALAEGATTRDGILLHATARSEKEWPVARWTALGRALAANGVRIVLPWGTDTEQRRSGEIAAVVPNATVPERLPLGIGRRMRH